MTNQFLVSRGFYGDLTVAAEGATSRVMLATVAETGSGSPGKRKVWVGAGKESVILIFGKRGTGKSYTLGALLEGYATVEDRTPYSEHQDRRGVLLLDPIGNTWTAAIPVEPGGPELLEAQHQRLLAEGLAPCTTRVQVWVPKGFHFPHYPAFVRELTIDTAGLDLRDLADLLGLDLFKDPQGIALEEAYNAVVMTGYRTNSGFQSANQAYTLQALADYLKALRDHPGESEHHRETIRALVRTLEGWDSKGIFIPGGTPLSDVIVAGTLSILMLPDDVGEDLRKVVARVLLRAIYRDRSRAVNLRNQLRTMPMDAKRRAEVEAALRTTIPRTVVALDEAQELVGEDGGEAKEMLDKMCLKGRNLGISMVLATQRPTTAAISDKIRSQADCLITHRLHTPGEIKKVLEHLPAPAVPTGIRPTGGDDEITVEALLSGLEKGQVLLSSSYAATDAGPLGRSVIANIRPRITAHPEEE